MPFLLATPVAEAAVATTARVAIPKLVKYLAKNGGDKLIKKYGQNAFEAVLGTTAGVAAYNKTAEKVSGYVDSIGKDTESTSSIPKSSMEGVDRMTQMDAVMAVPNLYKDTGINKSVAETGLGLDIGDKGEKEKERARIAEENKELMKGSTPPVIKSWEESYPDLSGKIADSSPPPSTPESIEVPQESFPDQSKEFSKPITYNKDDVKKQTDKLVPEKVELGPLSAVEKQTAIALKGNKPDYYSRAVEAITNAKQDKSTKGKWKSIIQSNSTKEEMNYLGLTEFLQGNESVTKEELLKLVKDKNIAPDLVFTKIPKSDQLDFSTFSIGGAGNTTSQYVIQISKDFDAESLSSSGVDMAEELEFGLSKKIYQATGVHLKESYGRNAVVHARAQIGFNPTDLEDMQTYEDSPVIKNASEKLNNTFIVDEVQSDWIQDIQKFGTKDKPKFTVLKGSEITPEYIEDNYEDIYDLRIAKFQTQKDLLENTGMSTNKVLYRKHSGDTYVEKRIEDDLYYVFYYDGLTPESRSIAFQEKEQAMDHVKNYTVENLPITQSKEYVKLMLDSLIKEAVLNGTDSIGITNGQIQGDRYEGQDPKKAEGLKKFYDKIVIAQLEKVATQYGVKTEAISIEDDMFSEQEDVQAIPNRMKMSMQNGFVLKKVRGDILYATLNDSKIKIPDFFTIYSDSGRAQGHSSIMGVLNADHEASEPERINNVLSNPNQYFIWVKAGSALSETLSNRPNEMATLRDYVDNSTVDFSMPITIANPGNNLTTPEDNASEGTTNMTNYSSYILDYKNKGIDLSYEHDTHQIIKMPLPKKLQKEILGKSFKISKRKTQANRLTA
jgi:hypothetical protein